MNGIPAPKTPSVLSIDPHRLAAAIQRQNLGAFIERCFYELNAGQAFHHNWHLEAIAYHLAQVANGTIKRLVITLPPRSLKSLSASVAFPAWLLGHQPERRIICASYGQDLSIEYSNSFRSILKTNWYRHLFPTTRIDPRKDTETEMRTTRKGYRLSTTVGGALTGRGGSIIIIDDPMKAADASSEAARNRVNRWFDETVLSRLDNKKQDAIIVVMQRLHVDDLAGHVLAKGNWTHLNLPAMADVSMRIPIGPDRFHNRTIGDLLQPQRENEEALAELKTGLGSAAFSAQYQQQPVPPGGNMIKWDWFRRTPLLPSKSSYRDKIIQSWDTASKATELSDYSVGITALLRDKTFYILDVVRIRSEYPSLKSRIAREYDRWKADTLLIEDKGSGMSLIQDLKVDGIRALPIKPEADKVVRMDACTAQIERGDVVLPERADWLEDFQTELMAFPDGRYDDQVDALSQLINWKRTRSTYTLDNVG
ncbi:MAG: phage terminase large subunit [Pseudomonadota bacterium]